MALAPTRLPIASGFLAAALLLSGGGKAVAEGGAGSGDGSPGLAGLAQNQTVRMKENARKAQALLQEANADADAGNYKEAMETYRQAVSLVPPVPAFESLREAILVQYQRAALAYARQLASEGRYQEAEAVIVQTLKDVRDSGLPASAVNPELRKLLAKLKSGDGFEMALSPRHIENTKAVAKHLVEGTAFYEAGLYDKARASFHTVLQIDPHNEAALHGLETTVRLETQFFEKARNHARSEMTKEVAKAWQMPVPPQAGLSDAIDAASMIAGLGTRQAALEAKMARMIVPSVDFRETPLRDVIVFLTQQSVALDGAEINPAERGVSLVLQDQTAADRPVTLQLSRTPFSEVLRYSLQLIGLRYRVDEFAVTIVPIVAGEAESLITKTYLVPPGFLTANAAPAAQGDDPFGNPGGANAVTVRRVSAEDFLKQNGIEFPPGATVTYLAASNSLIVRNTARNLELVERMILGARDASQKTIRVDLRLMIVSEVAMKEMGFDWLMGQFNVPASQRVFAGGGSAGNGRAIQPGEMPFSEGTTPVGQFPMTSGLRSGAQSVVKPGIDELLAAQSATSVTGPAPGVLSIVGAFTDPQFQVMVRAINQHKGSDTLANTGVLLRPGQKADIRHVREFIHPTEYDPPELPQPTTTSTTVIIGPGGEIIDIQSSVPPLVTPAHPTAFETRELGNILEVEADVGADNQTVNMGITVDMTEFIGFINYGSPIFAGSAMNRHLLTENRIVMPVFEAIKETTQVTAYDGATILIGGLLKEQVDDAEDKVPILGDLPLIGKTFRSSVEQRTKRAIMLFATPRILDPAGEPINQVQQASAR